MIFRKSISWMHGDEMVSLQTQQNSAIYHLLQRIQLFYQAKSILYVHLGCLFLHQSTITTYIWEDQMETLSRELITPQIDAVIAIGGLYSHSC